MTDQPATYSDPSGAMLTLDSARGWGKPKHVHLSIVAPAALDRLGLLVPTARLLAMIDTEDPDAMRAYLRETAPDFVADTLRPADGPAADHFDYLDAVPEADSPDDTDAPDPVEQMRESGRQLGEAWRALSDAFREASKGSNR